MLNTQERPNNILNIIEECRMSDAERHAHNKARIPAYAIFYDAKGKQVWSTKKDPRYHLVNGTTAINKGAVRGVLINLAGDVIDEVEYKT